MESLFKEIPLSDNKNYTESLFTEISLSDKYLNKQYKRDDPRKKFTGASQQTLQSIKKAYNVFVKAKANNTDLSRFKLTPYVKKDPETKSKHKYHQLYRFYIEGRTDPKEDYYKGRCFEGLFCFPSNYPEVLPTILMDELKQGYCIQMVNFFMDGEVCFPKKHEGLTIEQIFMDMDKMIYSPNADDAANIQLGRLYKFSPETYWEMQREQAKQLKSVEKSDQ